MTNTCGHSPWCEDDRCCCDKWEKETNKQERAIKILANLYQNMRNLQKGESLTFDNSVEVFRITKIQVHETPKD